MTKLRYSDWANAGRHLAIALGLLAISATGASAIPSFADQTGQPCVACHVGSFGPQLTPFGRQFKLEGYTLRSGETFTNPVSAMAIASFVNTATDQAGPPADHYGVNNNATIDQISVFVAGGAGEHFGGFTQWTYNGIGRSVSWDNMDLRATMHASLFDMDVLAGISLNNSPAVQDAWNTLPAWGYPFTSSGLAPAPGTATVLSGAFAQTVLGASVFAYWDSTVYTEVALYFTPGHNFLSALGTSAANPIGGAAPYFRVAYQKDYGTDNFEVGAFAFMANVFPGGDMTTGTTDHIADVGVDGSYQYMGDGNNIYQVDARYTHETQHAAASFALGGIVSNLSNSLDDFRIDASYYWHNMVGGSFGFFNTTGSADPTLYSGNTTFKPDSTGFIFQVDGTLFGQDMETLYGRFNLRVGLQYFVYTKFDGAGTNYDGTGRNASDNNTLRIFLWTAL